MTETPPSKLNDYFRHWGKTLNLQKTTNHHYKLVSIFIIRLKKNLCELYLRWHSNLSTWVLKQTHLTTRKKEKTCSFNNRKRLDTRLVWWCRNLREAFERIVSHEPNRKRVRAFISPLWKEDRTAAAARPEDNDEPRGEWQQTNRARTVHTTTCRRPLESCAVNYVHKFRIYSGSHEWPAAQLGAVTPSSEWENIQTNGKHRLNRNTDAKCTASASSHTDRQARRLRRGLFQRRTRLVDKWDTSTTIKELRLFVYFLIK